MPRTRRRLLWLPLAIAAALIGSTDTFSRAVAQRLSAAMGQPVVIENRGGAGGGVGTTALAKAPPDGYTLGLSTTGTHAINPALYGARLGYDPIKDFTPLTLALTSKTRSAFAPEVPTMEEAGVPGYSAAGSDLWFGIMAPAGLPRPLADRLQRELVAVLHSPDMQQTIRGQFFDPYTSTPEEFLKVIRDDGAKWERIVKESRAKVD